MRARLQAACRAAALTENGPPTVMGATAEPHLRGPRGQPVPERREPPGRRAHLVALSRGQGHGQRRGRATSTTCWMPRSRGNRPGRDPRRRARHACRPETIARRAVFRDRRPGHDRSEAPLLRGRAHQCRRDAHSRQLRQGWPDRPAAVERLRARRADVSHLGGQRHVRAARDRHSDAAAAQATGQAVPAVVRLSHRVGDREDDRRRQPHDSRGELRGDARALAVRHRRHPWPRPRAGRARRRERHDRRAVPENTAAARPRRRSSSTTRSARSNPSAARLATESGWCTQAPARIPLDIAPVVAQAS